jgi:hypothetical protein
MIYIYMIKNLDDFKLDMGFTDYGELIIFNIF